jgi:hypothetical protein
VPGFRSLAGGNSLTDVTPAAGASPSQPLSVRLTNGTAFYNATGGGGGGGDGAIVDGVDSARKATVTAAGALKTDGSGATQPISGTVAVSGSVSVTGPLTDTQLRATAVPVSGTFWPATQPVSVAATLPVSGPLTDTQLRATAVPVSGAFWQSTQPVSGPLTDTQLRATAVPVSVAATLPVSGPLTDTQLRASAVPVSGPLTDTQLRASAVPVSLAALPALAVAAGASSSPVGSVSLGNSLGKAAVMKTGTLASSATTADQVILTYTVTSGKTFYLEYLDFSARLTTYAATATFFGALSLETPSGTKVYTIDVFHAGATDGRALFFPEPIPVPAAAVIRVVCTPSAVTAMTWRANFGGYEK